jgi:hypothetical protein
MAVPTAGGAETMAATSRRRAADAERRHAGWVAGKETEAAAGGVLGPAAARVLGCPKARVEAAEVCAAMSRRGDGEQQGGEWLVGRACQGSSRWVY